MPLLWLKNDFGARRANTGDGGDEAAEACGEPPTSVEAVEKPLSGRSKSVSACVSPLVFNGSIKIECSRNKPPPSDLLVVAPSSGSRSALSDVDRFAGKEGVVMLSADKVSRVLFQTLRSGTGKFAYVEG